MADPTGALRAAGCVFAEEEARLILAAANSDAEVDAMVLRRTAGTPLEQVLGWAEFCGRRILVEPGVFVPRRRTELLARLAREVAPPTAAVVVDLCTGTGAVAAVLADSVAPRELHAVDLDPAAVHCARRNLPRTVALHHGDLFDALPGRLRRTVDVITANAPYVPTAAIPLMPSEAREHEGRVALDGGPTGTDVHRRITRAAPEWLAPGGQLLIETGRQQAAPLSELFLSAGLVPHVIRDEELDATVVLGARCR